MENRIVEIARKKAQKNTGKSRQADWKGRDTNPAFFVRTDAIRPPTFPPDIKLERRNLIIDSGNALIIPLPLRAVTPAALALKPAKPASKPKKARTAAKSKSTTAKPRVAKPADQKKTARKAAPRKPRAKKIDDVRAGAGSLATAIAPPATVMAAPAVAEMAMPDDRTPLPRARAVAVYRKNNVLDIVGYWMRTRMADLAKLFAPRPETPKHVPKMADLIAENTALRQEIARLRALQ
ncbi:hypothetical protein EUU23_01265 [Sphingorhabdus sp. IMCC26285]|uniref:Uncharacterized protein n=1 Tax=Sphingorhabdus profundilacus TaxID=2509718 RepID=A0A6I4LU57_9SPHN|nr:hypothetical protein [Sphingorhabdus profundilacus]MVZ96329.1 hypothetical protein [Sphingorhabdus profundilacus]